MQRQTKQAVGHDEFQHLLRMAEEMRDHVHSLHAKLESQTSPVAGELHKITAQLQGLDTQLTAILEQWQRLHALVEIGNVINSSLELQTVLNKVMDTIIELTGAGRAFLMLRKDEAGMDTVVARNWEQESIDQAEYEISRTVVQHVVNSGQPVLTTNAQEDPRFGRITSVITYSLRSILCVPLTAKGTLIGVIYADNKVKEATFEERDCDLLTAFANQAAVALENARLYENLSAAYHETVDALVGALDARDRETEGHTRRVVQYSLLLADCLGLSAEEKLDLKRGALMHDIGKLSIPDAILLKAGPLTAEEHAVMRRHTENGLHMLEGIEFLHGAVGIISAHHENFDGTGYPLGLKGEAIPLGARIFAVADAFDAITSDRRYRQARSYQDARREIVLMKGKQFDPNVVEAFLSIPEGEWERVREAIPSTSGRWRAQEVGD